METQLEELDESVAGWIIPRIMCPLLGTRATVTNPYFERLNNLIAAGKAAMFGESEAAYSLIRKKESEDGHSKQTRLQ